MNSTVQYLIGERREVSALTFLRIGQTVNRR